MVEERWAARRGVGGGCSGEQPYTGGRYLAIVAMIATIAMIAMIAI